MGAAWLDIDVYNTTSAYRWWVVELIVIEPRLTGLLVLRTRLMGMMFVLNWRTLGVRSGAHLAYRFVEGSGINTLQ